MQVAQNIQLVRSRLRQAAERANRDPAAVRLIGVTKGATPEAVQAAIAAGLRDFGENFVQEASERIDALGPAADDATWHFIGHLQSNKAKSALGLFDMIHSVDSLRLARQLSQRADAPLQALLEVNVAGEASKSGFSPAEVNDAVSQIARLPNIDLQGLMTIAPAAGDPEAVRPVFRELRQLAQSQGLTQLSMGMTDDFEVAIAEGATLIRVGRAIFGERA